MVVLPLPAPDEAPPDADIVHYLKDMGLQLALLSVSVNRPEAALHFLRAMMAASPGGQPAENAAPAAAT